jgi:hypothetical protein
MKTISCTILALSFALMARAVPAQDVKVTAAVSSDVVGIDDQFQLTVTVTGQESGNSENPRLPSLNGFKLVGGPSVSTQFQWINGRTSSSKSYIYILLPEKEGQFTIDAIEVRIGGKAYKTEPVRIRVTSATAPRQPSPQPNPLDPFADEGLRPRRSPPSGDQVFVTAEVDRASVYPGQQVTLSYHLYTEVGITGLQLQESPPLTGFWVEDLKVETNPPGVPRVVNGREYREYVVKKQALFPTATGRVTVPSSTFAISAKTSGDFFGMFAQTETLYRKTREVILEVKPLPVQGRPSDFSNAVGSFNLSSSTDTVRATAGEAVSLRVKLEGRGNLKMIPDLGLPPLPDFTVYSSKRADNVHPVEGNQLGGDKTWEYVIVPKAPGQQILPALSFSYFDPEKGSYETVRTKPILLQIARGSENGNLTTGLSGIDKQNLTRQGTDINFIKLTADDLRRQRPLPYHTLWFFLIAAAPLFFNLAAYLYQKERSKESTNAALIRSRRARRLALTRLRHGEKAGRTQPRTFYSEAAVALSGYLADKLSLPGIEVTGDTLERTLSNRSVPSETVRETVACLQECEFGRFVSASSSPESMRRLAERIRKTIEALERA